jgi:23S rRNA G2069 N7-methylase RlmK/C1962 C5-methylase RlmI
VIILDPPTFSRSKGGEVFRVERDGGKLVAAALPLLRSDGVLFVSANATTLPPEGLVRAVEAAVAAARRTVVRRHYVAQPPDFPISRAEPAYLKTAWWRIR